MDIEMSPEQKLKAFKRIVKNTNTLRAKLIKQYKTGIDYYNNKNDISGGMETVFDTLPSQSPLRNWNSKVSSNFHHILVNQKKSYLAGTVPSFDIDNNDTKNKQLVELLPDKFGAIIKELVKDAALAGSAWLFVWHDSKTGEIKFAPVPPNQIVPVYKDSLTHELLGVRRTYSGIDAEGKETIFEEFWTDTEGQFYQYPASQTYESMQLNSNQQMIDVITGMPDGAPSNVLKHDFGIVPFIEFRNNADGTPDLDQYKGLIDSYDLIYNGFINDVQDIQQVILVLTNYGGANLDEFMRDLREHKAIKMEDDGEGGDTGVDTLNVDIPVEARTTLLNMTRDNIYEHAQAYDPAKLNTGTAITGVALKMMYGSLELKVSDTESEFVVGLKTLIRLLLNDSQSHIEVKWPRTAIQNRSEDADIVAKLADVTSKEAVAKSNPIVDDWQEELKDREDEASSDQYKASQISNVLDNGDLDEDE